MSCFVGCVQGIHDRVVVEAFAEGGIEFTAVVVDVGSKYQSHPVTLLPTEVVFFSSFYDEQCCVAFLVK